MTDDPLEEHPNRARHHRRNTREADSKKSTAASQEPDLKDNLPSAPEMLEETPDNERNRGDFPDRLAEQVESQPAQIARRSPRRRRHPPTTSPAKRKRP